MLQQLGHEACDHLVKQPSVAYLGAQQFRKPDLMWPNRAAPSCRTQLQYLPGCSRAHLCSSPAASQHLTVSAEPASPRPGRQPLPVRFRQRCACRVEHEPSRTCECMAAGRVCLCLQQALHSKCTVGDIAATSRKGQNPKLSCRHWEGHG